MVALASAAAVALAPGAIAVAEAAVAAKAAAASAAVVYRKLCDRISNDPDVKMCSNLGKNERD